MPPVLHSGPHRDLLGFSFDQAYAIVAWLAWIPNLVVAEWLVLR